jgi:hypothetical protein
MLTEYLNYFAAWRPHFCDRAALNAQSMMSNQNVPVVARNAKSFPAERVIEIKAGHSRDATLMSQVGVTFAWQKPSDAEQFKIAFARNAGRSEVVLDDEHRHAG